MILSRTKPVQAGPSAGSTAKDKKKKQKLPRLEDFLTARDYTGALTLLEFVRTTNKAAIDKADQWLAYCAFHLGDYQRARQEYEALVRVDGCHPDLWCDLAVCYVYLGMYKEARDAAAKAPNGRPQNRLVFHLAHKFGDEQLVMSHHKHLQNVVEDQLSLAAMHYLRTHYQEAIDVYKKLLLEKRELLALNVYLAMCYHRLDYYDVSQEVLASYVQTHADSTIAINLKACNYYRLFNGKAAEAELKGLQDASSSSFQFAKDLIRHNLVIFRDGEGALQVLPQLVGVIPEARLNLVVYHLRQDDFAAAYRLIKDVEPSTPQEYILKAVANAAIGQDGASRDNLKLAQNYYQLVGNAASECDTIPGRQSMASCYFLLRQFDDVLIYLNSIKSYFYNDDTFNFNFAQASAATGNFSEAEETFLLIQSEKIKSDYVYISWLARCFIMNRKPEHAWELYLKMETSADSFSLLQVMANDCYKMGQFYYAAKAFDVLEKLDPNPEYWEGKRGACIGQFQLVVAGRESRDTLRDIIQILQDTANSQAELIAVAIRKWAKDKKVPLVGQPRHQLTNM